jgi:cell division protein FtsL
MTQVLAHNINNIMKYKERIVMTLIVAIVLCVASYMFLVHKAIVNVVEREKIVKDIREKSTIVSDLESKYLTAKNKINIELAHAKGFQDAEVTSYISKKSLTAYVPNNEL